MNAKPHSPLPQLLHIYFKLEQSVLKTACFSTRVGEKAATLFKCESVKSI